MQSFSVDKHKCRRDGICAAVCPIKIIEIDEKTRFPHLTKIGERICINCGHCLAVCPYGAISLSSMRVQDCPPMKSDWRIYPARIENFLKSRRSIRNYKPDSVDRVTLEKLIDIARFAPSGVNRQPVRWLVIQEREKVRRLTEIIVQWMRGQISHDTNLSKSLRMKNLVGAWERKEDWICRGAPHLIFAYASKDDMAAPQACTIAMTYLELIALSFGLGACWAGYVHVAINMCEEAQKFLGLSSKAGCFGVMMIGRPKFHYHRIPLRNSPRILWR